MSFFNIIFIYGFYCKNTDNGQILSVFSIDYSSENVHVRLVKRLIKNDTREIKSPTQLKLHC